MVQVLDKKNEYSIRNRKKNLRALLMMKRQQALYGGEEKQKMNFNNANEMKENPEYNHN